MNQQLNSRQLSSDIGEFRQVSIIMSVILFRPNSSTGITFNLMALLKNRQLCDGLNIDKSKFQYILILSNLEASP